MRCIIVSKSVRIFITIFEMGSRASGDARCHETQPRTEEKTRREYSPREEKPASVYARASERANSSVAVAWRECKDARIKTNNRARARACVFFALVAISSDR